MESTEQGGQKDTLVMQTIRIPAEPEEAAHDGPPGQPVGVADDPGPETTNEEEQQGESGEEKGLPLDLMDIFESEEMVEAVQAIPGLQRLTMSEVAAKAEGVLEELRSRFPEE